MSYPPTDEQQAAIDAFRRGENTVIEAGAGTGKTSTLKFLAQQVPMHQGIYMAYNASIAREARSSFPSNVSCKTVHGHTRDLTPIEQARMDLGRQNGVDQAKILGLDPWSKHRVTEDVVYAGRQLARVAMETVTRYARSADTEITRFHVPTQRRLEHPDGRKALAALALPYAQKAWADIMSKGGNLRWEHDFYRKRFQLEDRIIPGRFLFLDEAQDTAPVVAAIVKRHMERGYVIAPVGDRNQAINGWMGAVDAMDDFGGTRLQLTKSFRFGPVIADEANKWLQLLDAKLRITGHEPVASTLGDLSSVIPDAILTRVNATAVSEAMKMQERGIHVALAPVVKDETERLARAALSLKERGTTDHRDLCAFDSWGQVQDFVEQDHAGGDLKVFVDLIDEHGAQTVLSAMKRVVSPRDAQVTITTAHRCKGLEWDRVKIASDFKKPQPDRNGDQPMPSREDMMLAYVAVTRAKKVLDTGGLSWVNDFLPTAAPATATPHPDDPWAHKPTTAPESLVERTAEEEDRAIRAALRDSIRPLGTPLQYAREEM